MSIPTEEMLRLLGQPQQRSMSQSGGSPMIQHSAWACGCRLQYTTDRSGQRVDVCWERCVKHP